MYKIILTLLPFLIFGGNLSLSAQKLKYSPTIEKQIEQILPKVIEWRRDFHQFPELSNREFKTAEKIAAHLESLGLKVTTGVAHTGVVALLEGDKPGPVILLRADIDGLPVVERVDIPYASKEVSTYAGQEVGVMHACGHDTHIAIMMGVAEILTGMKKSLKGTVKFVFQPAEEGAPQGEEGGAKLMVDEGVLTNPTVDVAFALHIDASMEIGYVGYRPGGTFASVDDFRILVKGKQSHGAYPWNSVDPVVTSAQIINGLQTVISRNLDLTKNAGVVTVGSIHGGVRSNIIPEEVEMIGTIRALSVEDRDLIHERVRAIAENTAAGMGAEAIVEIPYTVHYPVTYNHLGLTVKMLPSLEKAAGKEKVVLTEAATGAEDFSYFSQIVPGFYFSLGGRPSDVAPEDASDHHTPGFFIDDSRLDVGVKAFVNIVIDYMNDPKIN